MQDIEYINFIMGSTPASPPNSTRPAEMLAFCFAAFGLNAYMQTHVDITAGGVGIRAHLVRFSH